MKKHSSTTRIIDRMRVMIVPKTKLGEQYIADIFSEDLLKIAADANSDDLLRIADLLDDRKFMASSAGGAA